MNLQADHWTMNSCCLNCRWVLHLFMMVVVIQETLLNTCEGLGSDNETLSKRYRRSRELRRLRKVLGSIDKYEKTHEDKIGFLNSALKYMEIETNENIKKNLKRKRIAKVLLHIEHTTNKALARFSPLKHNHEKPGKTVDVVTPIKGKTRKVFIPTGWMYCTVEPPKCYTPRFRKRYITLDQEDTSQGRLLKKDATDTLINGLSRILEL